MFAIPLITQISPSLRRDRGAYRIVDLAHRLAQARVLSVEESLDRICRIRAQASTVGNLNRRRSAAWDCQLSKRSSRLTAARSEWKVSKAKEAGSLSSCLLRAKCPIDYMSVDRNFPKEDIKRRRTLKFEEGGH